MSSKTKTNTTQATSANNVATSANNQGYTANSTPTVPQWLVTPAQNLASNLTSLTQQPASNFMPTQNATQQAAQAAALNLTNPTYSDATSTLSNLPNVQSQSLLTGLQNYMNPYESAVIDPVMQAYAQQAGMTQAQQEAGAAATGAFGGSRYGVQQALTAQQLAMGAGQTLSPLLNQDYTQATTLSAQDAQNRYAAQVQNQQAALQKAQQQAAISTSAADEARQNQAAQQAAGQQQYLNDAAQAQYPLQYQQQLAQLFQGLDPSLFTGTSATGYNEGNTYATGQESGTQNTSGTTQQSQGLGSWFGNFLLASANAAGKAAGAGG